MLAAAALLFNPEVQAQTQIVPNECDPLISGLASVAFPGWGQALNDDGQRKWIMHFAIGLGSTLAMIYRWQHDDGRIFRTARILWSFFSGMEAYATCYAKLGILTNTNINR